MSDSSHKDRTRRQVLAGAVAVGAAAALSGARRVEAHTAASAFQGWVNILDRGGVPDGITDNRASFQTALDEVRDAGGGVVLLPPGAYFVDTSSQNGGSLKVHEGCGIVGVGGWPQVAFDSFGVLRGAHFILRDTENPLLDLERGTILENLRFLWPDQPGGLNPIEYPPAVVGGKSLAGTGANGILRDLVFYNAWEVFDFGNPRGTGRWFLYDVQACAFKTFLRVQRSGVAMFLNDILISVAVAGPNSTPEDQEFAQENCSVIETDEAAGLKVQGIQVLGCRTFLNLIGANVLNLAQFDGLVLDGVPELIRTNGVTGINNGLFSNCTFRNVGGAPTSTRDALALTYERPVGSGDQHNLTFTGCVFRGAMNRSLFIKRLGGSGLVFLRFNGCWFHAWGLTEGLNPGQNVPALDVQDDQLRLEVQGCTFLAGGFSGNTIQGIRARGFDVLKVTDCTFIDCHRPVVVGSGGNLLVSGNVTTGSLSGKSLTLSGGSPSSFLVANNLFDGASDL